jgi:1-acyl-sn-glycerol-3-phosphate acyltransferase
MRSRIYAILTVPVFGILYCYTAIIVLLCLILAWLHLKKPIHILTMLWAKSIFPIMGKKFKVRGKENISKSEKYILVANHGSLFDIVAIMSFYPGISWFGHERLLKIPLFGKILKMTDYIPFREPTVVNTRHMLNELVAKSKQQTVAIFPEGTRTPDGEIKNFYKGFIYLFRTSGVAVLPVTLNGFFTLKPKNRFHISFDAPIEVVIHKPLSHEELSLKSDSEIIDTVKTIIKSAYKQHTEVNNK